MKRLLAIAALAGIVLTSTGCNCGLLSRFRMDRGASCNACGDYSNTYDGMSYDGIVYDGVVSETPVEEVPPPARRSTRGE